MKVFIAHSLRDLELVDALRFTLGADGHEVVRPDEMAFSSDLLSEISAALRSSELVVAIVTSSSNPNLFYELGLAAGANVPTLVAASRSEFLPGDVASIPYVQLTGEPIEDARTIAQRARRLEGLASPKALEPSSAEAALKTASEDPAVLESLAPSDFERLVASLFRERGYDLIETPPAPDSGVDLVLRSPDDGQVLLVQAKKLSRQSRVSVESVRELLGATALASDALGILVSTAGFTAAATALADGAPVVLRTLHELLAARTKSDLTGARKDDG